MKTITLQTLMVIIDSLDEYITKNQETLRGGRKPQQGLSPEVLINVGIVNDKLSAKHFNDFWTGTIKESALIYSILNRYPDLNVIKGTKESIVITGETMRKRIRTVREFIHGKPKPR